MSHQDHAGFWPDWVGAQRLRDFAAHIVCGAPNLGQICPGDWVSPGRRREAGAVVARARVGPVYWLLSYDKPLIYPVWRLGEPRSNVTPSLILWLR